MNGEAVSRAGLPAAPAPAPCGAAAVRPAGCRRLTGGRRKASELGRRSRVGGAGAQRGAEAGGARRGLAPRRSAERRAPEARAGAARDGEACLGVGVSRTTGGADPGRNRGRRRRRRSQARSWPRGELRSSDVGPRSLPRGAGPTRQ